MSQKKEAPKTTIVYRGVEYPYYKTNRGNYEFEQMGYTVKDIAEGKQSAMMANIYCQLRDCAKRSGNKLEDSFNNFLDHSDTDIFEVYARLKKAADKIEAEANKNQPDEKK